jgi:hypothetical protein
MIYDECPWAKIPDLKDRNNPKTVSFARRAWEREKQRKGLLAYCDEETFEEWLERRLDGLDMDRVQRHLARRQLLAKGWRAVRDGFFKLPQEIKIAVKQRFAEFIGPKTPASLRYLINQTILDQFWTFGQSFVLGQLAVMDAA